MPNRQPHDPFTDAPLRPTTSNATSLASNPALRNQTSQHSLRSNASTTSTRSRPPPRAHFAPALTRRGTTPRYEDEVLADSDSEQPNSIAPTQRQTRTRRYGSPDSKYGRAKSKSNDEQEFLNRQPDGNYLLGIAAGFGENQSVPQMTVSKTEEELELEYRDAHYVDVARQYFTGPSPKGGKKNEDAYEQYKLPMAIRIREQAVQQLEDERWMYE